MRKLLLMLLVVFCCSSLFAADVPKNTEQTKKAVKAENVEKVIGKIVVIKEEGKPDVYKLVAGDKEYVLLPSDKLEEIKKIEKFEEKMFEVELEAQLDKEGNATSYMIKSFVEKQEQTQPATEQTEKEK